MRRPDLALNVAAHGAARRGVLERAPDVRCAARRRAVTFLKLRRHGGAVTLESRRAGLAAIRAKSRSYEAGTDHGASRRRRAPGSISSSARRSYSIEPNV